MLSQQFKTEVSSAAGIGFLPKNLFPFATARFSKTDVMPKPSTVQRKKKRERVLKIFSADFFGWKRLSFRENERKTEVFFSGTVYLNGFKGVANLLNSFFSAEIAHRLKYSSKQIVLR